MSDNSQKTHLGEALNVQSLLKALNQVHGIAKCLPATAGGIAGSIMGAMNFETSGTSGPPKASIPHFGPEYLRYPTQPGDKGVCGLGPWLKPSLDYRGWKKAADQFAIAKRVLSKFNHRNSPWFQRLKSNLHQQ